MRKSLFLLILLCLFVADNKALTATQNNIQAIVFDYGGVVANYDRKVIIEYLCDTFRCPEQKLRPVLQGWKSILLDDGDERAFWNKYADTQNILLPDDWYEKFVATQVRSITPIPETICLVKVLQNNGYTVALLSNVTAYQAKLVRLTGHYDFFQPLLLSCELGIEKPDPKIFEILLERLAIPPSEIIFIDDKEENVGIAQAMGIHAIHYSNTQALEEALKELSVL